MQIVYKYCRVQINGGWGFDPPKQWSTLSESADILFIYYIDLSQMSLHIDTYISNDASKNITLCERLGEEMGVGVWIIHS